VSGGNVELLGVGTPDEAGGGGRGGGGPGAYLGPSIAMLSRPSASWIGGSDCLVFPLAIFSSPDDLRDCGGEARPDWCPVP
jgi:hypothetical protein